MNHLNQKIAQLARGAIFFGIIFVAFPAQAYDFVSVDTPAILYDAPSLKANKLFIASRYLPLEQIVTLDNWVKVRDASGQLYWIEKRALSSKRFVVVKVAVAGVFQNPDSNAAVVFKTAQQVALEMLGEAEGGWLKVRHQDGATGYVKTIEVWGD
jgi:SH3-like domain-containing protein